MKQVNVIIWHVPNSSSARQNMRSEIWGLIIDLGMPIFFITINSADVYNPVVKFLADSDINVDALSVNNVPKFWEQSLLIAKDPDSAMQFFYAYMKAFINCLLWYDSANEDELRDVIMAITKHKNIV